MKKKKGRELEDGDGGIIMSNEAERDSPSSW